MWYSIAEEESKQKNKTHRFGTNKNVKTNRKYEQ